MFILYQEKEQMWRSPSLYLLTTDR
ncbi:MAG: hypothetical protein ACLU6Y_00315 [Ruminococcus sp.]